MNLLQEAKHMPSEEQAVLIHFDNEDLDASIHLQEALYDLLEHTEIGIFDGNEVGGGKLVIFLYGLDAELLFKHVEPTLRADPYCDEARVVIRWGGPGAPEREVFFQRTQDKE